MKYVQDQSYMNKGSVPFYVIQSLTAITSDININIVWYIVCVCRIYLYIILLMKGSVLFCSILYHRNADRGLALNKLSSSDTFRLPMYNVNLFKMNHIWIKLIFCFVLFSHIDMTETLWKVTRNILEKKHAKLWCFGK